MWGLHVGLLWSSLVWCSISHGASQPAPTVPSKTQPGREVACPGLACWGTFPASFAGVTLSLLCWPVPPARTVSSASCKHQRCCQTKGAISWGRCMVHPQEGLEVHIQGQPSWWTSQQAAAPGWLSSSQDDVESPRYCQSSDFSIVPGSNEKGSCSVAPSSSSSGEYFSL